jgi:hypothetical protein
LFNIPFNFFTNEPRYPLTSPEEETPGRPSVILKNLKPDTEYTCRAIFIDPYGNRTELAPVALSTKP